MGKRAGRHDTIELDGSQVRAARTRQQLTQVALAAQAGGVSRGYLSVIEAGPRCRVSRAVAERLATALGTSLEALLAPPAAPGGSSPIDRAATLDEVQRRLVLLRRQVDEVLLIVERLRGAEEAEGG